MTCDRLTRSELLEHVLNAIKSSDWRYSVLSNKYPFVISIRRRSECYTLRIYIINYIRNNKSIHLQSDWTDNSAKTVIESDPEAINLLLAWNDGYGLIIGYEFAQHEHQTGEDVQQIRMMTDTLSQANQGYLSIHIRARQEIVAILKPSLLCDYAIRSQALHRFIEDSGDLRLLSMVAHNPLGVSERELRQLSSTERSAVLLTFASRIREIDFIRRVLSAYSFKCAMCIEPQFNVSVVHIESLAGPGSTDDTSNGIALCKFHRKAFERGLIRIQEDYRLVFNSQRSKRILGRPRKQWEVAAKSKLRRSVALPAERNQRPSAEHVRLRGVANDL
jgi:putative restriction endonuclease